MSKPITTNRKAHRDYHILESIECGIELKGSEVKSLRDGKMNLDDSFARIDPQGVTLYNSHISPYAQASYLNVDPERPRRLLLRHSQIERLFENSTQKGLTLIPLKAYFNDRGLAKIELALCKGKRLYDKRQDLRRRDADLEIRRALKGKRK